MKKIIESYTELTEKPVTMHSAKKKRIVMLLGAGFSVDKSYPTGGDLNNAIASMDKNLFSFDFCGRIVKSDEQFIAGVEKAGNIDDVNNKAFRFLVDAIKHYTERVGNKNFNYEDFYDFIDTEKGVDPEKNISSNAEYRELAKIYLDEQETEEQKKKEFHQMVHRLTPLFNQIIAYYIKEKKTGIAFYDDTSCSIDTYPDYSNFIEFLIETSKSSLIDVFTLNHDLLFESFNRVVGLEGKISDGFDDYGSNYYATIRIDHCDYKCRLERYTGKYSKPIRLYKLHGSIDYVPFYKTIKVKSICYAVPQDYIKIKKGIAPFNVYKNKGCERKYVESLNPYNHADFLSGTKVKVTKYDNKYLYKNLHKRFRNALRNTDTLIIIGYGGKDKAIEEQIFQNFKYYNKKTYIIDFNPKEDVYKLKEKLNATLLIGNINEKIKDITI